MEKWWHGMSQITFSLEIVSIDGYIHFLVRTADNWRDMVEARSTPNIRRRK
jgi:hypothetical protein